MSQQRNYMGASLQLAGVLLAVLIFVPLSAHAASKGLYQQINLVSDLPNVADFQDANLVNAWGLTRGPTTPWWVADNGAGVSTLYQGNGSAVALVVTIPPPLGGTPPAAPTGTVFNTFNMTDPTAFVVSANGKTGASRFLFATEDGTIAGWTPAVDGTNAILAVDRSSEGAVYKGLTLAQVGDAPFLYATNFKGGTVEMFDADFQAAGSFTDPMLVSNCPFPGQCYAPFGIQNLGDQLYVTFALQDADKEDDVGGPARGFVDVFDTSGHLLRRFAQHGHLNSPWGLALAPSDFGAFSGDVLVGNFGDGRITAFDPQSGIFRGQLWERNGHPIIIDGLWALAFGNDTANNGAHNELFFTAGPNDEANGLFGKIVLNPSD
jgi:uncharacterized protein (TIGR03118 family)